MATMGLFKLSGKKATSEDFEYVANTEMLELGRDKQAKEGDAGGRFYGLGSTNQISRQHATIFWSRQAKKWKIKCKSKNGMTVDKKDYAADEKATLRDKSAIRCGKARFYFLLPRTTASKAKASTTTSKKRKREEVVDDAPPPAKAPKPAAKNGRAAKQDYRQMLLNLFSDSDVSGKASLHGLSAKEIKVQLHNAFPHLAATSQTRANLARGIKRNLVDREIFVKVDEGDDSTEPLYKLKNNALAGGAGAGTTSRTPVLEETFSLLSGNMGAQDSVIELLGD